MAEDRKEFMIEDARLIFMNFSGKEGQYNQEGQRNFSIMLTPEVADTLAADGWNIKVRAAKTDEDEEFPYIPVTVRFEPRPPRVTMLSNGGKTRTLLDESTISVLDTVDILNVDVLCNGYEWNVNGKSGIKAYLKTMFVTINEDALERKYAYLDEEG